MTFWTKVVIAMVASVVSGLITDASAAEMHLFFISYMIWFGNDR